MMGSTAIAALASLFAALMGLLASFSGGKGSSGEAKRDEVDNEVDKDSVIEETKLSDGDSVLIKMSSSYPIKYSYEYVSQTGEKTVLETGIFQTRYPVVQVEEFGDGAFYIQASDTGYETEYGYFDFLSVFNSDGELQAAFDASQLLPGAVGNSILEVVENTNGGITVIGKLGVTFGDEPIPGDTVVAIVAKFDENGQQIGELLSFTVADLYSDTIDSFEGPHMIDVVVESDGSIRIDGKRFDPEGNQIEINYDIFVDNPRPGNDYNATIQLREEQGDLAVNVSVDNLFTTDILPLIDERFLTEAGLELEDVFDLKLGIDAKYDASIKQTYFVVTIFDEDTSVLMSIGLDRNGNQIEDYEGIFYHAGQDGVVSIENNDDNLNYDEQPTIQVNFENEDGTSYEIYSGFSPINYSAMELIEASKTIETPLQNGATVEITGVSRQNGELEYRVEHVNADGEVTLIESSEVSSYDNNSNQPIVEQAEALVRSTTASEFGNGNFFLQSQIQDFGDQHSAISVYNNNAELVAQLKSPSSEDPGSRFDIFEGDDGSTIFLGRLDSVYANHGQIANYTRFDAEGVQIGETLSFTDADIFGNKVELTLLYPITFDFEYEPDGTLLFTSEDAGTFARFDADGNLLASGDLDDLDAEAPQQQSAAALLMSGAPVEEMADEDNADEFDDEDEFDFL